MDIWPFERQLYKSLEKKTIKGMSDSKGLTRHRRGCRGDDASMSDQEQ